MENLKKYNELVKNFFRRKLIQKKQIGDLSKKYNNMLRAMRVFRNGEIAQRKKITNLEAQLEVKIEIEKQQKKRISEFEDRENSFRQRIVFLEDFIRTLTESNFLIIIC